MKPTLLFCSIFLPLAATAQKLVANHSPITYQVGDNKSPLYHTPADTAKKTGFFLSPNQEIPVVGEFSPKWLIVKRQGFLYLTPKNNLTIIGRGAAESSISDGRDISQSEGFRALDEKNGFRNYHFGDNISKYPSLVPDKTSEKSDFVFYTNPNDNLKIGDIPLKDLSYGFYKGQLSTVLIRTVGAKNTTALRGAFEILYGPGFRSSSASHKRGWLGKKVTLFCNEEDVDNEGIFLMSSREFDAQQKADENNAVRKAASDL